jgi:hypothetical protein
MKTKVALAVTGTVLGSLTLASCGGGGNDTVPFPSGPPPSTSSTTDLNTADVLSIVQTRTSETASPIVVDGGAIAVVPTDDETGEPIPVNGA